MKHLFKKMQSPLRKIGKKGKTKSTNHILNNIEVRSFRKRKKRVVLGFLRKFNVQISKEYIPYYFLSGIILIVIFSVFIIVGPYLKVKQIEIIRDSSYVDLNMAYTSVDTVRGKKLFSLDTKKIAENIINFQNNIDLVTIDIIFPNRIDIELTSSPPIFSTSVRNQSFIIVKNGTIIPNSSSGESFENIELYGDIENSTEFIDYKRILDATTLKKISLIKGSLKENILSLNIYNLHYFLVERELAVELEGGMLIFFDLTKDIDSQIEKLVIFNKENGDITAKNIIYIDNRITNKVFYCDIETEFDCRRNIKNIYGDIKQKKVESSTSVLTEDPS